MSRAPIRICFVCTQTFTLATLYKGLFPYLRSRGYEIDVIVGDREYVDFDPELFGSINPYVIPMQRMPHPVKDPIALLRFVRYFAKNRYDVIHVSTPKASLLGAIAAKLTRNGKVVFVHRRLVYQMWTGMKRRFFEQNDRVTSAFSDLVIPVSGQIRDALVSARLAPAIKVKLIGQGASNGTDVHRFSPDRITPEEVATLRKKLAVPPNAPVLLYLSRVGREKGVDLLPTIFDRVRKHHPEAVLVVVGPEDEREPPEEATRHRFEHDEGIRRIGFVSDPSPYYALSDVFIFTSYFEGIANALLEVAAHERVTVAFDVPGVNESVLSGVSGVLVNKGDVDAAADAVTHLLSNPRARQAMGRTARDRIVKNFSNKVVWEGLDKELRKLIATKA